MKRQLFLLCALAACTGAFAQLYKWVDKEGRVTYSDRPPPGQEAKALRVDTGPPVVPRPTATERDREREKERMEAKEKASAAAEAEQAGKRAQSIQENCDRARAYLRALAEGGRLSTYNSKGERVLLNEQQIAEERARTQKVLDEACKSS